MRTYLGKGEYIAGIIREGFLKNIYIRSSKMAHILQTLGPPINIFRKLLLIISAYTGFLPLDS